MPIYSGKTNSKKYFVSGTAGDENKSQPGYRKYISFDKNVWKIEKFETVFYCENSYSS